MPIEILMPALSPTMKDGTLAKWLKKEGDAIKSGDVIAEIETDKAMMEVESIDNGIIGKILVPAGTQNVMVNSVIALILEKGEAPESIAGYVPKTGILHGSEQKKTVASQEDSKKHEDKSINTLNVNHTTSDNRKAISPLAKRIASESGISIESIQGTGPHGRIIKRDVEGVGSREDDSCRSTKAFIGRNSDEYKVQEISTMRKVIAQRLQESKQNVPHFYLNVECCVDNLLLAREAINKAATKKECGSSSYKVSVNDIVVKCVAAAIRRKPFVNCSWDGDKIKYYNNVDISIAVSIPDGLITPIVKNADQKGVVDISAEIKDLALRARKNQLRLDEFQGGGFSISNLGMYGVESFQAIINPPQACIASIGSVVQKPVVKNGQIVIANMVCVGISVDHRALDGAKAAEFLAELKSILENPVLAII